ncbi:MAG TPA: carboxypeptidase-like regulatory domain-containing protein, partial [Candidatus Acidoferrales bacterium]
MIEGAWILLGKRVPLLLGGVLALLLAFGVSLSAQDNSDADTPADSQLAGAVHTADGTTVPGATVRVIQTSSGKAWVTWTDEDGKFEFPALPEGHFSVEISQLGFSPTKNEVDLTAGTKTPIDLKLDIGTLAAITAPPAAESAAKTSGAPTGWDLAKAATDGAPSPSAGAPRASSPNTTAGNNASNAPSGGRGAGNNGGQRAGGGGGRNAQQGGPGGNGPGGGRRSFQQVGLNGQNQNPTEPAAEDQSTAEAGGQLGQAASADAVQMLGTIAMGQMPAGGFPQAGDGGPDARGAFGAGGVGGPGAGGPGGPVVPGAGGPGGGGPGGGARGGGRGGGGGRGRGPQAGQQGVAALWGAQRVMRQRANRVHYSFYDTFGDSALNARPDSLNVLNAPKISSWTQSAGMNIGGPLKIPHIYDGTDKTFFYVNFGGTWSRSPVDEFSTVPTLAERNGDFSNENLLLYNNTFNPSTQTYTSTLVPGCPLNCSIHIPTSCPTGMSPAAMSQCMSAMTAQSLLNYIPLPNLCPTPTTCPALDYHLQTNVSGLSNRLNVNVTHQISAKLSFVLTYNLSDATSHSLNNYPGIEGNSYTRGQTASIGLNQNWTKTILHTNTLYYSRNRSLGLNEFSNLPDNIASTLGIHDSGAAESPFDYGLPSIGFTNFTGLSDPNPSLDRSQTYRYVDGLRWIKDKHTLNIGEEIRKMDINHDNVPAANGQFSFTGLNTSQLTSMGTPIASPKGCGSAPAPPCVGSDFADFLLGFPANAKLQSGQSTYFSNWGFVWYATDDWHMFPKFTLTYGVRYEAFAPPTEVKGHIANLDVSSGFANPTCVTPQPVTITTGGATLNCVAGPNQSLFYGHYNNWAPRVGIAWQPPGKWFSGNHQMTVRAGFSQLYVESYMNTLSNEMSNQPPFATANTLTTQVMSTGPSLTLQSDLANGVGRKITNTVSVNPNYQVPYALIWNFGFEYNLTSSTFLELMYTGTRGVHLDELLGFGPSTASPNVAGFTYDTSGAFSNMNALQVRLQKRMTRGLTFTARYTYSKSLDDASTIGGGGQTVIQNNADPRGDYGLSSFNMTHQLYGQFTYQLPFGDRQRFATKGWEKDVFGAWRVNGSFTAHSGTPYTVRIFSKNLACENVPGTNSERADQMANPSLSDPTIKEWFNTSAFADPAADGSSNPCLGDAPRNSVIGPGAFTINSGLTKTVQFG